MNDTKKPATEELAERVLGSMRAGLIVLFVGIGLLCLIFAYTAFSIGYIGTSIFLLACAAVCAVIIFAPKKKPPTQQP